MDVISEGYKKLKEEFLKKKSAEKFEYLYEKLTDLEEEEKECDHYCVADDEKIEEIINRQNIFDERLNDISNIEEKVDGIIKILKLEEKVEEYVEEEKGKRFWKRIGLLTSGKTFTVEEFYSV